MAAARWGIAFIYGALPPGRVAYASQGGVSASEVFKHGDDPIDGIAQPVTEHQDRGQAVSQIGDPIIDRIDGQRQTSR